MTPLIGLGLWIWDWHECNGGSIEQIISRCMRAGVDWVAIKAGGNHTNGQVTRERVEAFREAGIECGAWWYSVPGDAATAGQLALIHSLVEEQGVEHLICDAESEWEAVKDASGKLRPFNHREEAKKFAFDIRTTIGPDVYLADAPWPIISSHRGFPWQEFGAVVDARMDQLYWALSGKPFGKFAQWADDNWKTQPATPPRCPIGCNVDYSGQHHGPPEQIGLFLDRYADCQARSLWSYQHLAESEWAVLEQRA